LLINETKRGKMNKKTLKMLQLIAWIIGFAALALLIYGIISALI